SVVGVLGVPTQVDGQLHGFVELGVVRLLNQLRRFRELVRPRFHLLARILNVLARFLHRCPRNQLYAVTSKPMFRAVPITVRTADSIFVVLRSTSLSLAISSTCFFVTLPTLLRFGSAEPFTIPAARSSKIEAGGVFKIKVNVRSV